MPIKMAFVVRGDLGMSAGKIAAQVAHAAFDFGRRLKPSPALAEWQAGGQMKLVLAARSVDELRSLLSAADGSGSEVQRTVVVDGGRTEVPPDTVTVIGLFGEIDSLIGSLPLLKEPAARSTE